MKKAWTSHPEVPISKAVRAGDLVFTSAYGPWLFDPLKVAFGPAGDILDDGTGNKNVPFEDQVHRTFGFLRSALEAAGCTFADVVDCQVWLADVRDFAAFNTIYRTYFPADPPVRSVFPTSFMFDCKIEMKMIAYKPL